MATVGLDDVIGLGVKVGVSVGRRTVPGVEYSML